MNKNKVLLATVVLLFTLGYASIINANPPMESDDSRFVSMRGPILGLNEEELVGEIGRPIQILRGDCQVPYAAKPGQVPIPVPGNNWVYRFQGPNSRATLNICVLNKYAVGEQKIVGIVEGKRIYSITEEALDLELIKKAIRGELNEMSRKDRTKPLYAGPEYIL